MGDSPDKIADVPVMPIPRSVSRIHGLWLWTGKNLKWDALLSLGVYGAVKLHEWLVAIIVVALVALPLLSKLSQWNGFSDVGKVNKWIRVTGYSSTIAMAIVLAVIINNNRGTEPWSTLLSRANLALQVEPKDDYIIHPRFDASDPSFDAASKKAITREINRFYDYLLLLALKPTPNSPKVRSNGEPIYDFFSIIVVDPTLDAKHVVYPYAQYIFSEMTTLVPPRHRANVADLLSEYFAWSYTGLSSVKSPTGMLRVLEFLKERHPLDTDAFVADGFQTAINVPSLSAETDFVNYMVSCLKLEPGMTGDVPKELDIYYAMSQNGFESGLDGRWRPKK